MATNPVNKLLPTRVADYFVCIGPTYKSLVNTLSVQAALLQADLLQPTVAAHESFSIDKSNLNLNVPPDTELLKPEEEKVTDISGKLERKSSLDGMMGLEPRPSLFRSESLRRQSFSSVAITSEIQYRYPAEDHKGSELDKNIGMFAFPHGYTLSDVPVSPSTSSFIMTESDGTRVYGIALTFHHHLHDVLDQIVQRLLRSMDPGLSPDAQADALVLQLGFDPVLAKALFACYVPFALCLTSHYPFYSQLTAFLRMAFQTITASHSTALSAAAPTVPVHLPAAPAPDSLPHYRALLSSPTVPRIAGLPQHLAAAAPLERLLANLIFETPLPPLGRVLVLNRALYAPLVFARPPPNKPPLRDFSLFWLFTCLSVDNILTLFAALNCERKVLLVSADVCRLNLIAEALTSLLFPLYWRHIYIPVLPAALTDFVCAPMPFICGVHASNVPDELMLDQVILANLDHDTVYFNNADVPALPDARMQSLLRNLRKAVSPDTSSPVPCAPYDVAAGVVSMSQQRVENAAPLSMALERSAAITLTDVSVRYDERHPLFSLPHSQWGPAGPCSIPHTFDEDAVTAAFLKFYVRLLGRYRAYLEAPSDAVVDKFDKERFLADHEENCAFLTELTDTQMFQCFVDDRYEASRAPQDQFDVLFFDENITQSNEAGKPTPFLSDTSQAHSAKNVHLVLPVDTAALPADWRQRTAAAGQPIRAYGTLAQRLASAYRRSCADAGSAEDAATDAVVVVADAHPAAAAAAPYWRGWPVELVGALQCEPRAVAALTGAEVQSVRSSNHGTFSLTDLGKMNMKFFADKRLYTQHFHTLRMKSAKHDALFKQAVRYFSHQQAFEEDVNESLLGLANAFKQRHTLRTGTSVDAPWEALMGALSDYCQRNCSELYSLKTRVLVPLATRATEAEQQLRVKFAEATALEDQAGKAKTVMEKNKKKHETAKKRYAVLVRKRGKNSGDAVLEAETSAEVVPEPAGGAPAETEEGGDSLFDTFSSAELHRVLNSHSEMEDASLALDQAEIAFQFVLQEYDSRMPRIIDDIRRNNAVRLEEFRKRVLVWAEIKRDSLRAQLLSVERVLDTASRVDVERDLKTFSEGSEDFLLRVMRGVNGDAGGEASMSELAADAPTDAATSTDAPVQVAGVCTDAAPSADDASAVQPTARATEESGAPPADAPAPSLAPADVPACETPPATPNASTADADAVVPEAATATAAVPTEPSTPAAPAPATRSSTSGSPAVVDEWLLASDAAMPARSRAGNAAALPPLPPSHIPVPTPALNTAAGAALARMCGVPTAPVQCVHCGSSYKFACLCERLLGARAEVAEAHAHAHAQCPAELSLMVPVAPPYCPREPVHNSVVQFPTALWGDRGFAFGLDNCQLAKDHAKEVMTLLEQWAHVCDQKHRRLMAAYKAVPPRTAIGGWQQRLVSAARESVRVRALAYEELGCVLLKLQFAMRIVKGELKQAKRRYQEHKLKLERELGAARKALAEAREKRNRLHDVWLLASSRQDASVVRAKEFERMSELLNRARLEWTQAQHCFELADRTCATLQKKHDISIGRLLSLQEKKEKKYHMECQRVLWALADWVQYKLVDTMRLVSRAQATVVNGMHCAEDMLDSLALLRPTAGKLAASGGVLGLLASSPILSLAGLTKHTHSYTPTISSASNSAHAPVPPLSLLATTDVECASTSTSPTHPSAALPDNPSTPCVAVAAVSVPVLSAPASPADSSGSSSPKLAPAQAHSAVDTPARAALSPVDLWVRDTRGNLDDVLAQCLQSHDVLKYLATLFEDVAAADEAAAKALRGKLSFTLKLQPRHPSIISALHALVRVGSEVTSACEEHTKVMRDAARKLTATRVLVRENMRARERKLADARKALEIASQECAKANRDHTAAVEAMVSAQGKYSLAAQAAQDKDGEKRTGFLSSFTKTPLEQATQRLEACRKDLERAKVALTRKTEARDEQARQMDAAITVAIKDTFADEEKRFYDLQRVAGGVSENMYKLTDGVARAVRLLLERAQDMSSSRDIESLLRSFAAELGRGTADKHLVACLTFNKDLAERAQRREPATDGSTTAGASTALARDDALAAASAAAMSAGAGTELLSVCGVPVPEVVLTDLSNLALLEPAHVRALVGTCASQSAELHAHDAVARQRASEVRRVACTRGAEDGSRGSVSNSSTDAGASNPAIVGAGVGAGNLASISRRRMSYSLSASSNSLVSYTHNTLHHMYDDPHTHVDQTQGPPHTHADKPLRAPATEDGEDGFD